MTPPLVLFLWALSVSFGAAIAVMVGNQTFQVDSVGVTLTIGAGMSINSWGPSISFTSGVYTVLAGDEWGQLALIHFIVAQ